MDKLTVLDLARCFFWGLFGVIPIFFSRCAGLEDDEPFLSFLALVAQVALCTALYIAGGKA